MAKRERAGGEVPKRKVGRPKGTPKSPGSGRQKRTRIQIAKDKARDSIWDYVVKGLSGQAVKSRGPTGKQISQPLTEDNQIRLLQTAWRKLEPDLNATAVSADIVTEHVHTEPKDPRQVARAVLSVLEHAKLAEQAEHPVTDEPIAEPPPSWPEPPAQLRIGRDKVIELQATPGSAGQPEAASSTPAGPLDQPSAGPGAAESASSSSNAAALGSEAKAFSPYTLNAKPPVGGGSASGEDGASVPSPGVLSPPRKPQHADKVEVDSNSSHIWFNGESKRWAVLDSDNVLHGRKRDRAEALAHAERLPRGAGPWQAHPFEPQDMGSGWHERRDNRATISNGKLNVVRRMPRGAR